MWEAPNAIGAEILRRPIGSEAWFEISLFGLLYGGKDVSRAALKKAAPCSVRLTLRVVRLRSPDPKWASRSITCLLATALDRPNRPEASGELPGFGYSHEGSHAGQEIHIV